MTDNVQEIRNSCIWYTFQSQSNDLFNWLEFSEGLLAWWNRGAFLSRACANPWCSLVKEWSHNTKHHGKLYMQKVNMLKAPAFWTPKGRVVLRLSLS